MKKTGFFITGTDTGVGKTWATLCVLREFQARGMSVAGMKPVATGGVFREGRLVNEDALALRGASSMPLPYEEVNPYLYAPPVSPHIAAARAGVPIELGRIVKVFKGLSEKADCVLVEGVGGWKAPLSGCERVEDLALALGLPVILVVGLRLGCLNHALLTRAAMASSGVGLAGWIANRVAGGFPCVQEHIETLTNEWSVPPLAILPYGEIDPPLFRDAFPDLRQDEILRARGS